MLVCDYTSISQISIKFNTLQSFSSIYTNIFFQSARQINREDKNHTKKDRAKIALSLENAFVMRI